MKTITILKQALIAAVALLVSTSIVQTAVTTFASRASFDAAFPGSVTETWEGFAPGTTFTDGTGAAGIIYSTTGADAMVTSDFLPSTPDNSLGSTVGGFFVAGSFPIFTFSAALDAFAIDINTISTEPGSYAALTNLGDRIFSTFDPFPGEGTGQFIGFSSTTPFTSVQIEGPGGEPYTLDTLRAATPGPTGVLEPGSLVLLSLGLFGIAAIRRRYAAR